MKFNKQQFDYHGGYLTYQVNSGERSVVVARFRYGGMGAFKRFLIKNFSVEEYFKLLDSGLAPLEVLKTKGYTKPLGASQKSLCKRHGLKPTQDNLIEAQRREAAHMDWLLELSRLSAEARK